MDTPTKFKESKGATTLLLFSILILLPDLLPSRRTLYFSRFSSRKSSTLPESNLKVIWFFVRMSDLQIKQLRILRSMDYGQRSL